MMTAAFDYSLFRGITIIFLYSGSLLQQIGRQRMDRLIHVFRLEMIPPEMEKRMGQAIQKGGNDVGVEVAACILFQNGNRCG